jgi:hypothetical protein
MEMEDGFLGVESSASTPPAWFKQKTVLKMGGEKLASRWEGFHYFEGQRCASCRTISFKY